jgi:hypothetical protein
LLHICLHILYFQVLHIDLHILCILVFLAYSAYSAYCAYYFTYFLTYPGYDSAYYIACY